MLHEALRGRRLTRLEYQHELPKLQDRLLDAQFELRKSAARAVAVIVTGIPGAGRSEVVNELLGWLDPKFVTVYDSARRTRSSGSARRCGASGGSCRRRGAS
jgi:AMP-polyphosphate phosphotransferase